MIPNRRPKRPPRLANVFTDSPLYFVTCCTKDRAKLLACEKVHKAFLGAAEKITKAGNAVGRYVIMPDHVHAFLRIGREGRLGVAVKCIKERITKSLRDEPSGREVWQPGFFDHLLRHDESYAEKWEYVRMNPVRTGLVDVASSWLFQGEVVIIDRV